MFDGLQEGVVVIQGGALTFMNELSNRVLSEVATLGNFFKNKQHNGSKCAINPIDRKLFFLFEQSEGQEKGKKAAKKKKKKGSSSDYSKHSSETSNV